MPDATQISKKGWVRLSSVLRIGSAEEEFCVCCFVCNTKRERKGRGMVDGHQSDVHSLRLLDFSITMLFLWSLLIGRSVGRARI